MRLRSLFLPMLVLGVAGCRSAETQKTVDYDDQVAPPSELATAPAVDDADSVAYSVAGSEVSLEDVTNGLENSAAPAASQDPLAQDVERMKRIRQREDALSAAYIAAGDQLLDQADLEGALREFSKALEVKPTSQEARSRLQRVEALMGKRFAVAADFFDDASSRETVRRAQARLSAENAKRLGEEAIRRGDYDAAVEHLREAQLILSYHPLIATASLDERLVSGLLQQARDLASEARTAQQQATVEAARMESQRREERDREYRRNKLQTLFTQANNHFVAGNYKRAEDLAVQILQSDPQNDAATQMRDTARAARHSRNDQETRRVYREQWQRTLEELEHMDVPQTDPIVFDLKRWREVDARLPLEFSSGDPSSDADKAAVVNRLESVRIAPKFLGPDNEGSPLTEIALYLQNLTGVNFIVSTKVREDLDEEETTIKLDLPERSVKKVLDIINDTSENLRWKIEDGVVLFVTKEEMIGGQTLRMYEVRDIIHPVPSFAGREINISPSGGLEPPDEDLEEREGLVVTSDQLESLIRDNVAPESWDEDPANAVRITESGTMVVNQTPEVQAQIVQLLEDLREATGIMVDIQARFLKVEDNFLEDIGIDFRGLGQPGLGTNTFLNDFGDASTQADLGREIGSGTDLGAFYDEGGDGDIRGRVENLYDLTLGNEDVLTGSGGLSFSWTYLNDLQMELILRAVSKSERTELVTAPRVLVFNTARSNISVMNQVAYVQDFDVEIAQAASIADPIINVVQDGVSLDVRPVVSADRRFILMELRPTVARLRRPIQEIATTLGSQNSVTIQLPELDIQKVRTTVPMPDGGTVMLGGLKVSEKQDLRSGVPLLNKIPLVRFFFERKGSYVANQKLLILIKASIVIPAEHEPSPSQMGL